MRQRTRLRVMVPASALATAAFLLASSGGTSYGAPPRENPAESRRSGTARVKVVNPPTQPVPTRSVDEPARSPFQAKVRIELPGDQCCENGFVDVPAGKRLVIEYASALGFAPSGQTFNFEVGTLLNGHLSFDQNHLLPVLQQQHDPATSTATAGQAVRIYADPGPGRVMLRASRSGVGSAVAFMTVSGHLVDVP